MVDKWHEWVVRPEDFGHNFDLNGVARLVPSLKSWRKFIRMTGNFGEYDEVFDATWAMLRFGVEPSWECMLDVDLFMQLSGDHERTKAVRKMFQEWVGNYPRPKEVLAHYRRWLRTEITLQLTTRPSEPHVLEDPNAQTLANADTPVAESIEVPTRTGDLLAEPEIHTETVVEKWLRQEREKPWFERD
jgi:hypothetical protein